MAYMARQVGGGFTAGAKLFASQLNDELDHIIGTMIGDDNRNIKLKYNSGDEPTLEVWNSGGNVIEFRVGVGEDLALHVDSDGILVSAVATIDGPPFTVVSTTLVDNLNADTIDGKELAALIQTDVQTQAISSASSPTGLTLLTTGAGADSGSVNLLFDMRDTAANVDAWWRFVGHGDDTFRLQQYDHGTTTWIQALQVNINDDTTPYFKVWDERTAVLQQVATTKSRTLAQVGAFYEGVISTGAKQATFIVGDDVDTLAFTTLKYIFRGGTLVGDTVIDIKRYGSDDLLDQTVTITLPNTDAADTVYTIDIADIAMEADGFLTWTVTTADLHEDLSLWVIGYQEIKTD